MHRYDTFADDTEGVADDIDDEKRPTLGEVLLELRDWYVANYERLTPPELNASRMSAAGRAEMAASSDNA